MNQPIAELHHPPARRQLPVGRVTLMFSDIENSTTLLKHWRCERYAALQECHHELLQAAVARHRGVLVDTMGDAEFVVFERAADAVDGAVAAQRELESHPWPDQGRVRVRVGLHAGEPLRLGDDYVGMAVTRAWRICAAGHGGQILVSQEVLDALETELPETIRLRDHGEVWLKQLDAPERVYQVLADGLADVEAGPVGVVRAVHYGLYGLAGGHGSRSVPELLEALASAVTTGGEEVHLTPSELAVLAAHQPRDLREYRVCRLAAWIRPEFQLDDHFVPPTLRFADGEPAPGGHSAADEVLDGDLVTLLADGTTSILVVTGAPGSGKSTLLRHLEFQLAATGLGDAGLGDAGLGDAGLGAEAPVTFYASLGLYGSLASGVLPPPEEWLAACWRMRYAELPPLEVLLAEGRVVLILDGFNEMPHQNMAVWRAKAGAWKHFLHSRIAGTSNRAVLSCRQLDYHLSLSTPDLRVPRIGVQPLDDRQVQRFLARHSPGLAGRMWRNLQGAPQLEIFRSPFFLKQYVDEVLSRGDLPRGVPELVALLVDRAVRREIEYDNPRFRPGVLIAERDYLRVVGGGSCLPANGMPAQGRLLQLLGDLAYGLQIRGLVGGDGLARCGYETACRLMGGAGGAAAIAAGADLGILDEDRRSDEVFFIQPLFQTYFAAQRLGAERTAVLEDGAAPCPDRRNRGTIPARVEAVPAPLTGDRKPPRWAN